MVMFIIQTLPMLHKKHHSLVRRYLEQIMNALLTVVNRAIGRQANPCSLNNRLSRLHQVHRTLIRTIQTLVVSQQHRLLRLHLRPYRPKGDLQEEDRLLQVQQRRLQIKLRVRQLRYVLSKT